MNLSLYRNWRNKNECRGGESAGGEGRDRKYVDILKKHKDDLLRAENFD
ncbi:MAG: hypothetical protein K2N61_02065 [Lachnospiraceae bacterium]|nr:hypothetical protein [Lachnospiraceae bacterium]